MRAFPVLPPSRRPTGPVIAFVATPSTETPVAGVDVTWTTNAGDLGTPVSYYWDFGDGTVPGSGASIPPHYWVGTSAYTVTVTVTMDDDSTYTDTQTITPTEPTVEQIAKINKPYTAGTVYNLATVTNYDASYTANTAVSPDGTTTAGTLAENTATAPHLVYLTAPSGFGSSGTYHVVFYAKKVDMDFVSVTIFNAGSSNATVEANLTTGEVSQEAAYGFAILDSSVYDAGSGWYRVSMSVTVPMADPALMWISAGKSGVSYDGNGQASFTGTSRTAYVWGLHSGSGVDDYSSDSHYLGAVQTPAPTTVRYTELEYEPFASGVSGGTLGTFDDFAGDFYAPISNGAKQIGDSDIGWSGQSTAGASYGRWTIGTVIGATIYQLGAWFKFRTLPTKDTPILGFSTRYYATVTPAGSVSLLTTGELATHHATGGHTGLGQTITLNEWFWLGFAFGDKTGGNGFAKVTYRTAGDTTVEVLANDLAFSDSNLNLGQVDATYGTFSTDNYEVKFKMSGATLHTLPFLNAGGYPAEIIPPQEDNYIYNIDADAGDDANDGVTGAWQTITKLNGALNPNLYGIDSEGVNGVAGSGARLVIDSGTPFDVGAARIQVLTPSLHITSSSGQATIKTYHVITAGEWSLTGGGHTDVYQITMADSYSNVAVWSNNVYHEQVADLTALDAALAGASCVSGATLYVKPYGGTNPASDGKTYIHSIPNPDFGSVGSPAINYAAKDILAEYFDIHYLCSIQNGQYAIGNTTGFSGKAVARFINCDYGDKHTICPTANATNSEWLIEDCTTNQCLTFPLTSYMASGSGNQHTYRRCTIAKALMVARSADGADGTAFYSHGGYGVFDFVRNEDCDYGNNDIVTEGIILQMQYDTVILGKLTDDCPVDATGLVMKRLPRLQNGGVLTNSSVTVPVGGGSQLALPLDGTLSITNTSFDLRESSTGLGDGGLWKPGVYVGGVGALVLEFTGNTVRFGNSYPNIACPVFKDFAASNIASCNNNTYYIGASDVFAKDFDDGGGAADYTFAQWQALGYDAASTRLDP